MPKPRKPTAQLKLTGQHREDRHGDRFDDSCMSDKLIKPRLSRDGARLWDKVVALGRVYLKEIDCTQLQQLCEVWSQYRKAYRAAAKDITDKDLQNTMLKFSGEFHRLASRFGLNPVDRTRIQADTSEKKDDFDSFMKRA